MHQHATFTLSKINENDSNNDECKNTRKHLMSCTIHSIRYVIFSSKLQEYTVVSYEIILHRLTEMSRPRRETLNWIGLEHNAADILVRITCMARKVIADMPVATAYYSGTG